MVNRNKIIIGVVSVIIMVIVGYFLKNPSGVSEAVSLTYKDSFIELSVDSSMHSNYGLAYPVTYVFLLPPKMSDLHVYKRYKDADQWQEIIQKTKGDFFNGIEVVRFNYAKNRAYVSVGFSSVSDVIDLKITDNSNKVINSEYLGIAKYYDNRTAAVSVVADDWGVWGIDDPSVKNNRDKGLFNDVFDVLAKDHIWFTPAVVSEHMFSSKTKVAKEDWQELQKRIDAGYVEIASHSRTHPSLPYSKDTSYEYEITGNKQDIMDNLVLPYSNGDKEYVYAWIRPFGQGNEDVRKVLGQDYYLADRTSCCYVKDTFSNWDPVDGLYGMTGYSVYLEKSNLEEANKRFDDVVKQGGLYSIYLHPWGNDFGPDSWQVKHFDYIKDKTNLWYAGFGYAYMYHFVDDRDLVSVVYKPL
jgi:peptidoglycan/xylan/chitin deacetylase (PgdA/CDA1 family)